MITAPFRLKLFLSSYSLSSQRPSRRRMNHNFNPDAARRNPHAVATSHRLLPGVLGFIERMEDRTESTQKRQRFLDTGSIQID